MAWIGVDLDDTLLQRDGSPEDEAGDAMRELLEAGHRVTIWTARFARIQEKDHTKMRLQIEDELNLADVPFSDIWMGPKPPCDLFIGDNLVPYLGDWPQALATAKIMLKARGPVEEEPKF